MGPGLHTETRAVYQARDLGSHRGPYLCRHPDKLRRGGLDFRWPSAYTGRNMNFGLCKPPQPVLGPLLFQVRAAFARSFYRATGRGSRPATFTASAISRRASRPASRYDGAVSRTATGERGPGAQAPGELAPRQPVNAENGASTRQGLAGQLPSPGAQSGALFRGDTGASRPGPEPVYPVVCSWYMDGCRCSRCAQYPGS